ncbi:MAG: DUF2254 domain-containing protein [Streptomycetaceae bacterium]|nr:DUF2254 domain-containing protein [Streptomycetaceae bacterium]
MSPLVIERVRDPRRGRGGHGARRARTHGTAAVIVVAGAVLGWVVPHAESWFSDIGLGFDASTAQATLAAIAGGMITLAGFVVTAITLVVQTVQNMSPRLVGALGQFHRYVTIFGMLIGTALFSLVALSQVTGDEVPRLSTTCAVALVLADAVAVLYLLASLRNAVTGGGLSRAVGDRLRTVIDQTYPAADHAATPHPAAVPDGPRTPIRHQGRPGVIVSVDERRLTQLAAAAEVYVELTCAVGDFVGDGTVIGGLVPAAPGPDDAELAGRIADCVRYGPTRTVEQDPAYGLRLLADIAIRGLSPAVNDPTTAVQALDQIEDVLVRLAARPLGPAWLDAADDVPRVALTAPGWPELVGLALDESLLYGASNPQVVRRLRTLFHRLAAAAPEDRRAPVGERLDALDRLATAALSDPLLREVAGRPDVQGLGGSHTLTTGA